MRFIILALAFISIAFNALAGGADVEQRSGKGWVTFNPISTILWIRRLATSRASNSRKRGVHAYAHVSTFRIDSSKATYARAE